MFKKVYFRADGNASIGLGHVTRSIALADMLVDQFQCTFLVQNPLPEVARQIQEAGHMLVSLPETSDYLAEAQSISQQFFSTDSIVVLDGYEFKTDYQRLVKESGCKLVCIDDLHAWHFVADVVINHAGGIEEKEYSCENNTQLYLGPKHAILRQPFLRAAQQPRAFSQLKNVFICFGGTDTLNLTTRATQAALSCPWAETIHVVIGSAYVHIDQIARLGDSDSRIHLYRDLRAQQMADLMSSCEIAISPASGIAYEICSVGLLLIVGHFVENQKHLYGYLTKNSLGLAADNLSLYRIEDALMEIRQSAANMLVRQKENFDGKSANRLLGVFISLAMTIEQATLEDMDLYFAWANDPETRRNSIQSGHIKWEDHQKWFKKRITNPDFVFYIFRLGPTSIGQVRYDITPTDATISYSIDTRFRGMGLGYAILFQSMSALSTLHPEKKIIGAVKNDNFASIAVFRKLGFAINGQDSSVTRFEKS